VILGRFDPNYTHPWPRVRVGVLLTGISQAWAVVDFVLDTGASATCLHPSDAIQEVGIDPVMLTDPSQWPTAVTFSGVGGGVDYFVTPARYALLHDDGQVQYIDGTINVARWNAGNQTLPSLLGWDVLGKFSLFADPSSGRLELHPPQTP